MFRVAGGHVTGSWTGLENVGNESENIPGVKTCGCLTAETLDVQGGKMWINRFSK